MILAVLLVTVLIDVRIHKIPNIVLILLIAIQILSKSFSATNFLTVIIIFSVLYFFFSIGTIGAGDLKLIVIVSAGLSRSILFLSLVFPTAAILAVIRMLRNKNFYTRLFNLREYVRRSLSAGKVLPYFDAPTEMCERKKYSVHLSVPVFVAYLIMCLLELAA